jgi:formate hydrogenlyase subunit 6/NADH:ubiquinone oxidoreductase subunit I
MANQTPEISQSECVECGGCISTCPTEALSLSKFSPLELVFESVESSDETVLDCNSNIPCLVSLSPEYLVSMAILKDKDIVANFGGCGSCEIFSEVGDQIDSQISEANLLLEGLNSSKRIKLISIESVKDIQKLDSKKRGLFDLSAFQRDNSIFDSDTLKKAKEKSTPDRRKLFLMALQRVESSNHILLSSDLSSLSEKAIKTNCNNCQICYRVCPSGALKSDYKNSFIEFNSSLCLKCGLCIDVCEVNAIYETEDFSLSKLIKRDKERLIEFNIAKCHECDGYFTKIGDSNLCHRCQIEESEALELWS